MDNLELYEKDGYKVIFDARSKKFRAESPEGSVMKWCVDYESAEKYVVAEIRENAKIDRRSLSLSAITETGEEVTIVGVNLNTGKLKLSTDGNYEGAVYPNTPRLKKLIAELHTCRDRARQIANLTEYRKAVRNRHRQRSRTRTSRARRSLAAERLRNTLEGERKMEVDTTQLTEMVKSAWESGRIYQQSFPHATAASATCNRDHAAYEIVQHLIDSAHAR